MTDDHITPQHEPEVAEAIAIPDPRIRRLAAIVADHERAAANIAAMQAEQVDKAVKP